MFVVLMISPGIIIVQETHTLNVMINPFSSGWGIGARSDGVTNSQCRPLSSDSEAEVETFWCEMSWEIFLLKWRSFR